MSIILPRAATPSTATPAAAPAPEAPAVETQSTTPEVANEPLSPKFQALARQQKIIRRQQMEAKTREEALIRREAELSVREQEYKQNYIPKARFKEDTVSALSEAGLTYDDVLKAQLGQDPMAQALKPVQDQIKELKDAQSRAEEQAKEQQKRAYDQALNQIRNETKLLVDSNPEFETIKANDAQEAVVSLIEETFQKDGVLLTVEDASKQIEEYLLEQAVKMASLEKVKKRLAPQVAPVADPLTAARLKQQPPKTLTNAATTTPARALGPKERRERAIAMIQGRLQR